MTCLWVSDANTIEQHVYLLIVATPYADVGLRSQGTSLPYVHASDVFQQVIHTLYWRRLNLLTAQYSYHSRLLTKCQRRSRSSDTHLIELPFDAKDRIGINAIRLCRDAIYIRISECCHTQRTHDNLLTQACEKCVSLVHESTEHEYAALVENRFVHKNN